MNCNMLIDRLPNSVEIDREIYAIDWGYRANILIEIDMFSDRDDEQKLLDSLNIFYLNNIPPNRDKALEWLLWFHRCGELPEKVAGGSSRRAKHARAYCFEQDAALIYAAFRSQYGINLNKTNDKELHWWEFMAMFQSLSEDLLFCKVMFYRTADLSVMSKNQRAFIKRMRSRYAIKESGSNLDAKAKLAKRNTDMLEYVRKRMDECRKE